MTVEIEGADQLRDLARKLKDADKPIKAALVKELRSKTRPITTEIKAAVKAAPSHSSGKGLGYKRRAARSLSRMKKISEARATAHVVGVLAKRDALAGVNISQEAANYMAAHRARQAKKAEAGAGLRESIAAATSGSVTTSQSTGVGAKWKVRAQKMPNNQRLLPRNYNREKGWRHPVFGDRENWVDQHGVPYFDVTIKRHETDLRDGLVEGMTKAAEKILHPESSD
jgi:hypothetical protein